MVRRVAEQVFIPLLSGYPHGLEDMKRMLQAGADKVGQLILKTGKSQLLADCAEKLVATVWC